MHVACSTIEREVLAMVYAFHKFGHNLSSNVTFVFYVDHMVLNHLVNKRQVSGGVPRWVLMFLEYVFTIIYKPSKSHMIVDCLTRLSQSEPTTGVLDQTTHVKLDMPHERSP